MKGLDLSKLKKVSSDGKMTVFKHDMGHEVKIAHHKLSPKMLEELKKIPIHGQKMAEGGEPNPEPNGSPDDEDSSDQGHPPVNININAGQPQQGPQPASVQPTQQNKAPLDIEPVDQEQDKESEQEEPASSEEPAPSAEPQPDQQPAAPQNPVSTPMDPMTLTNQLNNDYAKMQQQVGNGSIHPKTLSEMFAKNEDGSPRGTLSKIGMFFSMMASGMGSGLTHQPNMILQAMQKEIDNDLEAQKATKTNQFNAWNAASQHVQAISGLNLQNLQAQYQKALSANLPIEAKRIQSEIGVNLSNQKLLQQNYAKQGILLGVLQHTLGQTNNMPPGPMKNNAMAAHQVLTNAVNSQAADNNAQTAQQVESSWRQRNMGLSLFPETQGLQKFESERHIPYVGEASGAVPQSARDQINAQTILDQKGKDLLNYIGQRQGLDLDRWNPQDRAVAQQKVEEMKNFYNDSIHGGALTEGRLGWYDQQFGGDKSPLDILPQIMGQTAKFKEMIKSNEARRDEILASYGAPSFPKGQTPLESPVSSESAPQIETMGGVKYKKVKGGWQKVG